MKAKRKFCCVVGFFFPSFSTDLHARLVIVAPVVRRWVMRDGKLVEVGAENISGRGMFHPGLFRYRTAWLWGGLRKSGWIHPFACGSLRIEK